MALLLRWAIILVVMAIASSMGLWLADNPGEVQLDWMGYRITTKLWVVLVALALVILLSAILLSLVMRVFVIFSVTGSRRKVKMQRQGIEALTRSIAALSLSDYTAAETHLKQSRSVLGNDLPLNILLGAHIASRTGNKKGALQALESMQELPDTRFLALASLSEMARRDKDYSEALRLAKQAYLLRPNHLASAQHYLGLLVLTESFGEAQALLKAMRWQKMMRKDAHQRLHARVLVAQHTVRNIEADNTALKQAHALDVTFSPAYAYITEVKNSGHPRRALRLLLRAWKRSPHPALIDILLQQFDTDSPAAQMKRAGVLVRYHPNHLESQIGAARIACACGQWDVARNHLKAALEKAPQARVFRLLATLEEQGARDDAAASLWLKRLATAEPDPAWHCTVCGHIPHHWEAVCASCQSFDSVEWGQPHPFHPPVAHAHNTLSLVGG
jgi:HemY protein